MFLKPPETGDEKVRESKRAKSDLRFCVTEFVNKYQISTTLYNIITCFTKMCESAI